MDLLLKSVIMNLTIILILLAISSFEYIRTDPILGQDCKVMQEPVNTHEFDLNPLHSTRSDYQVVEAEGLFLINICGSLKKKQCNGQNNVSVCFIQKSGKEIAIGRTNNSVMYDNGRLQFELQGDQCDNGKNTTVTIIMMCDYLGDKGPELIPASLSNCTYFFIWYSNISCTPRKLIDCIVRDEKGITYDLSRLTLLANNYVAVKKDNKGGPYVKYFLNVCQSVVMTHDIVCQMNSGTCATPAAVNDTHMRNLGDVTNGPYFENGVLKLKYERGDECMDKNSDHKQMLTIIEFICDREQHDSSPIVHRIIYSCEYHFIWKTSAACPPQTWSPAHLPIPPSGPSTNTGDCVVTNPITGDRMDLHSLKGQEYDIAVANNQTLKLSVCGPLLNSSCGSDAGACIQSTSNDSLNVGQSNTQLGFQETQIHLFYSNGSYCNDKETWNTHIMFQCGTRRDEGPKSYLIFGCKYIISWYTHLACEREISCTATNADRVVDLSYFASKEENYHVTIGSNSIVVNICRQIIPLNDEACPHRSGACIYGNNKPLSLGSFVNPPVLDEAGITVLKYYNGSRCPNHGNTKLSSVFHFICDETTGHGSPTFRDIINGCEYQFDWRTSIVCEEEIEELRITATGCFIRDHLSRITADLSALRLSGGHHVSDLSGKNYTINLCGSNDSCDGAVICEELSDAWVSYGQLVSIVHEFSENLTKMFYTKGAPCDSSGKTLSSAEVWLICAEDAGIGKPTVVESDACFVLFEWKTSAACGKIMEDSSPGGNKIATQTRNHRLGVRFGIIAITLILVGILFAMWVTGVFRKCSRFKPSCFGLKHRGPSNNVAYSRQRGNEEEFGFHDED